MTNIKYMIDVKPNSDIYLILYSDRYNEKTKLTGVKII